MIDCAPRTTAPAPQPFPQKPPPRRTRPGQASPIQIETPSRSWAEPPNQIRAEPPNQTRAEPPNQTRDGLPSPAEPPDRSRAEPGSPSPAGPPGRSRAEPGSLSRAGPPGRLGPAGRQARPGRADRPERSHRVVPAWATPSGAAVADPLGHRRRGVTAGPAGSAGCGPAAAPRVYRPAAAPGGPPPPAAGGPRRCRRCRRPPRRGPPAAAGSLAAGPADAGPPRDLSPIRTTLAHPRFADQSTSTTVLPETSPRPATARRGARSPSGSPPRRVFRGWWRS